MPQKPIVGYRLYMQARPPYPPETWDQVATPAEIFASIDECRKAYPDEPIRVFGFDEDGHEQWVLTSDPKDRLSPQEDSQQRPPPFRQQDTGQTLPPEADRITGTCEQCGAHTALTMVRLVGMGQDMQRFCCAECLADMAAGQEVLPMLTLRIKSKGQWVPVDWKRGAKR